MKIIHRIGFNERKKRPFEAAGIELPQPSELGLITFEIEEDDPRWKNIASLVEEVEAFEMGFTKFSEQELSSARFLRMGPSWHHGYPQPEDDFGYRKATYDLSNYCEACGIGARQKGPFRMKKPPNWGRRSILQMNWVFDEYFAKPDVWKAIFKPFGINSRPVLLHKTGKEIETVVQLENPTIVDLHMGRPTV